MTRAATRGRRLAYAFLLILVAGFAFWRWSCDGQDSPTAAPPAALEKSPAGVRAEAARPTRRPPFANPAGNSTGPKPEAQAETLRPSPLGRPTPPVFDFATMTPHDDPAEPEEERFETNDWFTEEDLQHPEIYFDLAEQMPELNRSEERRETLAFFLAYRDKLRAELDGAQSPEQRQQTLAVIERYDGAIERLRELVDAGDD